MGRLVRVLEEELGHALAFAVEHGKIAANDGLPGASIPMDFIERGLSAPLSPEALHRAMSGFGTELRRAATETLELAGLSAREIGSVILVGGSSLMQLVTDMARDLFPEARQQRSQVFTAVIDGLALATAKVR